MPNHLRTTASVVAVSALSLVIVACSGGGASPSPQSSGGPTGAPSGSPSAVPVGAIDHKTGATDVVLRYEEGGGFMIAAFAATMVPHFTLYGDGTIVFRDPSEEGPPAIGSVFRMGPMKMAKLSEEQVQDLLELALDQGGLAQARPEYSNDMVADASTAIFTVNAGGATKTVSIYALGIEAPGVPDGPARAAFLGLAQTLTKIDEGGIVTPSTYEPTAYRGILMDSPGVVAPDIRTWPWPDIKTTDFVIDPDPNGRQLPVRAMTVAEIEALGIGEYSGGFQNMLITGPDGKTYTFSLRPLLPDEKA